MAEIDNCARHDQPLVFDFMQAVLSQCSAVADDHPLRSSVVKQKVSEGNPTEKAKKTAPIESCSVGRLVPEQTPKTVPAKRWIDSIDYRTAFSQALSEGFTALTAREKACEYLQHILPASAIESIIREQQEEEEALSKSCKFSQLGKAGEVEALKQLVVASGLNKSSARGYLAQAKQNLISSGLDSAVIFF